MKTKKELNYRKSRGSDRFMCCANCKNYKFLKVKVSFENKEKCIKQDKNNRVTGYYICDIYSFRG